MAVPEYQKFFLPVLRIAGDIKDHSYGEMYSLIAKEFNLTEEDRADPACFTNETLPGKFVWVSSGSRVRFGVTNSCKQSS